MKKLLNAIDNDQNPFKEITSDGVVHPKYFVNKIDKSIYYVDPSTIEHTEHGIINLKKLKIIAIVFPNGDRVDFDNARTFIKPSTNLFTYPFATYNTTSILFPDGSRVSEDLRQKTTAARIRNVPRTAGLNAFLGNELSPEESEWLSVEERIARRDAHEAQKAAERNKGWFSWIGS